MNFPKVSDVVGIINKIAPFRHAEEWDNVGLQVGDPAGPAGRIMVALDPGPPAVDSAIAFSADLLLTHHPLIFSPLKKVAATDPVGLQLLRAARHNLAVVSLHTNFDIAAGGMNDLLAEILGVGSPVPLKVSGADELVKLSVFVPKGYEEPVLEALFRFSGVIGTYRDCSFRTAGIGTFRPEAGSKPFIGTVGKREELEESRIEVLVRGTDVAEAVRALEKAHPYEEPAYDLYPLRNRGEERGLGRIGELAAPTTLGSFALHVKERLGAAGVRYVGRAEREVRRVALCGGSGASLLSAARFRGADVLVTGDLKYHEAREAEAAGIGIVDAGHFATEKIMVQGFADRLRQELGARGLVAEVAACEAEQEPFTYC